MADSSYSNDTKQSVFDEICGLIGSVSAAMSLITHHIHNIQQQRVQHLNTAKQYNNITDLHDSLAQCNQSQYVVLHGKVHSNQPLQSTYHTTINHAVQLLYSQIKQINTYIQLFPLLRIPMGEKNQVINHQPRAADTQLLLDNSYNTISTWSSKRNTV
jgi:phage-related tail protein